MKDPNTKDLIREIYSKFHMMIQGDIEANSQHGIHEGMHEHLAIDKCNVPVVAKCPPWMGEVQHPWWIWRRTNMFAKNNWQIFLWLLIKSEGDSAWEVGERTPHENDNSKGASNQRREAGVEVYVQVYKAFKVKGCDLKWNNDSFWASKADH